MNFLKSLANRSFALLWSGQTISCLGDSLYTLSLAWWVLQKTGSATAMSGVLICLTIPLVLFLLLGGAAGDRLPRVRLMLISDLLRAAAVGLMAFLAFQQQLELWQIYVMSALFGTVRAFFYPTYIALVPDLVPAELLPSANSLGSISVRGAQLIGPAIGAGIIVLGGTSQYGSNKRKSCSERNGAAIHCQWIAPFAEALQAFVSCAITAMLLLI